MTTSAREGLATKNLMIVSQVRVATLDQIPGKAFQEAKAWSHVFQRVIFLCFSDNGISEYKKISNRLLVFSLPFSLSHSVVKTFANLFKNYLNLIKLELTLIKKYHIDLIREENLIIAGFPTFLVSKLAKIPFMTWLGGFERNAFEILYQESKWKPLTSFIISFLEYIICRHSSLVFTVSRDMFNILAQYNLGNIYFSPNFVDFGIFQEKTYHPITADQKIILLYSGRFEKEKGIDNLLEAIRILSTSTTQFQLHLVGYGTMEPWIRQFLIDHKLTDYVSLLGKFSLSELPQFYQAAHIFIIPSYTEGLPAALLEAMCSGCACVCTDVGVISSYIQSGKNGMIVPPNEPNALAESIYDLIQNAPKITVFGRKAHDFIISKSKNYMHIHGKLYSAVLQKHKTYS